MQCLDFAEALDFIVFIPWLFQPLSQRDPCGAGGRTRKVEDVQVEVAGHGVVQDSAHDDHTAASNVPDHGGADHIVWKVRAETPNS